MACTVHGHVLLQAVQGVCALEVPTQPPSTRILVVCRTCPFTRTSGMSFACPGMSFAATGKELWHAGTHKVVTGADDVRWFVALTEVAHHHSHRLLVLVPPSPPVCSGHVQRGPAHGMATRCLSASLPPSVCQCAPVHGPARLCCSNALVLIALIAHGCA